MERKQTTSTDDAQATPDKPTASRDVDLPGKYDAGLIPLLAAGVSQKNAAERVGCSTSTVERRVADPEFRLSLLDAHRELRDQTLAGAIAAANIATTYLLSVVQGREKGVRQGERIRAAIALRSGLFAAVEREGI